MQIPPTTALLHALSSLPAQAGQVVGPAGTPGNPSPTQPADRPQQAAPPAEAAGAARPAVRAASQPAPADSAPARNLPRGSIIDILV